MKTPIVTDEAYKYVGAPVLLIAGPGTGKTYQLAKRIQFLTKTKGISPDEITVITFTKEAAASMRAKLRETNSAEYIEDEYRPKQIYTMHGLGQQILSANVKKSGLKKDFEVVTEDDLRKAMIRDAAYLLLNSEADAQIAFDERVKSSNQMSEKSKKIINQYEVLLRKCNAIDFDDQITLACKLLNENPDILLSVQKKTKYLLIDEYQDINNGQYDFISLLTKSHSEGLFVVGDDDQSIYSFRGGSPDFIRSFEEHFGPESMILQMQTSRRCPAFVLESANSIVAKYDSKRIGKGSYKYTMKTDNKIVLHNSPSDDREAEIISAIIRSDIDSRNKCESCGALHRRDYFILIPNKNHILKIQDALRRFKIPYSSQGSSYQQTKFLELIENWSLNQESNFLTRQMIEILLYGKFISFPSKRSKITNKIKERNEGLEEISKLWNGVLTENESLYETLQKGAESSDLLKKLKICFENLSKSYLREDLSEFLKQAAFYTKTWTSLKNFFQIIKKDKPSFKSVDDLTPTVRVLTMQSAKGLQADIVCIIGFEDEVMPGNFENEQELNERARLFFVGMTRAKEQLHIFRSRKRSSSSTYKKTPHELKDSRFAAFLPNSFLEKKFHNAKQS